MSGTRQDWAELLPLLQAFVAGASVQKRDFGGRWVDTDEVYGVLGGSAIKHRLRPPASRMGVWSIGFTLTDVGSVNGALGTGRLQWDGADTDTPKWPVKSGLTLVGEAMFTPHEPMKDQP